MRLVLMLVGIGSLAALPSAHAAPAWEKPAQLATGQVYEPVVAASGAGVGVAWSEVVGEGCPSYGSVGCQRIRFALRRGDGSFSKPVTLSADGSHSGEPQLTITSKGEVLVSWLRSVDGDYSTRQLEVVVGNAASGAFGDAVVITSNTRPSPYDLVTDSGGDAALSWIEPRHPEPDRVHVALRPAGEAFGQPVVVAESPVPEIPQGTGSTIALADDGRLLVLWDEFSDGGDRSLYGRVRMPDGALTSPELIQRVDATLNQASIGYGGAAATRAGEWVVLWASSPSSCMYCFSSTVYGSWSAGAGFAPPQPLSPSDEAHTDLQLAIEEGTTAIAAWGRSSASRFGDDDVPEDIQVATREPGGSFQRPVSVRGTKPRLTTTRSAPFISWLDDGDGLFGTFRPEDRAGRVTSAISGPASVLWSSVAGAPDGTLYAAWIEGSGAPPTPLFVAAGPDDPVPPSLTSVSARRRVLIRGRDPLMLTFVVSERARVELRLRRIGTRRARLARTVSVAAGTRRIRVSRRTLRQLSPGRYVAKLRASDRAGQWSRERRVRIRLKRG